MGVSLRQKVKVGAYVMRQRLAGRKRYPLVLMLEPLFRCNLACTGCGKIDYPDAILNKRLSVQECLDAVDECGAPMVAIPGGEPLIHKEIGEIVKGIVARGKFVSLCTNALLLEKKLHLFEPSPYLFFSVHLDGIKEHHDKSVCMDGGYEKAVSAIKAAQAKGFAVNVNCTVFDGHPAEDIAKFLDLTAELGVGVSISPGYAYERAPDQEHFLNRRKTKELFRKVFALGKAKNWNLTHSGMFLDFLAGNQEFHCTPWGMPTRNIFGWQKPCYLLGEGYAKTFARADGHHRLGSVRHRRLRKMRQLHGALRLRADRGPGDDGPPAAGGDDRLEGHQDRRPDGAGNLVRRRSVPRNTSSTARCSRRCRKCAPTRRARRRRRKPQKKQTSLRRRLRPARRKAPAALPFQRGRIGVPPGSTSDALVRCSFLLDLGRRHSARRDRTGGRG